MKLNLYLIATLNLVFSQVPTFADTSTSVGRPGLTDDGRNLGMGIMVGEPTGITAKYWYTQTDAQDFGFSYSFNNYFAILSDYLVHFPTALNRSVRGDLSGEFVPFVGIGGILFVDSSANPATGSAAHFFTGSNRNTAAFGVRIPLGVEFLPRNTPIGLFVEVDPGLGLLPGTFGFIGADIGGRFYF